MSISLSWINLSASVGNKVILHNLTGAFGQSSINAVMGPSGCGKTSLMKCLNASNKFNLSPDSKIFVWKSSEVNSGFICSEPQPKIDHWSDCRLVTHLCVATEELISQWSQS